ncbi:flavin reductase family protein [Mycobacterium sp. IDR2000157661]|uniref:flavin reductase family protein n=1 Tax=Mycobacterium sp. IDR2000157661 TaxID=2867005 RepID=UPI001EE9BE01|nr:flavin reductase family protein [Mycobacterium sp. IDR2000157661]ULE33826.1 flavin reductase family protein [Mycobacterium sp. IDR2000157661]
MDQTTPRHIDGAELRRVYGCFPSGVTAVCALLDGVPVGMAASSFTPVSVDPPLVSVCVQNSSTTWPRLRSRLRLGVSVLAEDHGEACLSLSRKVGDRFATVRWIHQPSGSVFVHGASAWLDCRVHAEVPAGDHTIVLLEICELGADPEKMPLVFHHSRFRRLAVVGTVQESR